MSTPAQAERTVLRIAYSSKNLTTVFLVINDLPKQGLDKELSIWELTCRICPKNEQFGRIPVHQVDAKPLNIKI